MVSDSPSSRSFKSAHYLLACSLIVSLTFHTAREVQGECRAELARAMLSRSLHSQRISPYALQSYNDYPQPPNFDPRSVQISVKKLPYSC